MDYEMQRRTVSPPSTAPYYKFYAEKWDNYASRNVLLWFIHEKGLDDELFDWLGGDEEDD